MANGEPPTTEDVILQEIEKGHWFFRPKEEDRQAVGKAIGTIEAKSWEEALKGVLRPQVRRLLYTPVILSTLTDFAYHDPRVHYCFLVGGFAADRMGDLDLLVRKKEDINKQGLIVRSYADVDILLVVSGDCTSEEKASIAKDVHDKLKIPDEVDAAVRANIVYDVQSGHIKTEAEMLAILLQHEGVFALQDEAKINDNEVSKIVDSHFTGDKHDRDITRRFVHLFERPPEARTYIDSSSRTQSGKEAESYADFFKGPSDMIDYSIHTAINTSLKRLRERTQKSPRTHKNYIGKVVAPFFESALETFPEELESFRSRHPAYVDRFPNFYRPAPIV